MPAAQREGRHDPAGHGAGRSRGGQRDQGRLPAGPEVVDRPVVAPGLGAQPGVRVDRVRVADQAEHRQVVGRVAVRGAAGQVQALALGQRGHRGRLGLAMQQSADQPAGVHTVHRLSHRAQRPGQPEPLRDDRGQFHRRRGDQPHPLPGAQMAEGQLAGARPDPVGHGLVEDLLAQADDVGHLVPGHERERGLPGRVDVIRALRAAEPEVHLAPGHPGQVAGAEQFARGQPAGEVVNGRATDQRVVHIEERACRRIRLRRFLVNGGHRRRGGPGQLRALPAGPGQPQGPGPAGKLIQPLPHRSIQPLSHVCRVYKGQPVRAELVSHLVRIPGPGRAPWSQCLFRSSSRRAGRWLPWWAPSC